MLAFSQSNYKKGLVVTGQGDTLRGYINYREWNNNPEEFTFKPQPGDNQSQSFNAQTARYVAIEGYEAYETHRVSVSQDEVANGRLKEGMDTTTIAATVFLKLLLKGDRVNLYYYKDNLKERFYFLERGAAGPVELGYKVYLENTNIATSPSYKKQLAALAVKHQVFSLTQQIQSAEYTHSHLMRIMAKINGTTDTSISKRLEQAPGIRWFGSTGVNYTTFVYKGENVLLIDKISENGFYQFKDQVTTHSSLPRFSAGADIYLNPAVQRFIIRGEIGLAPSKSEISSHYRHSNYSTHDLSNVYRLSMLTLSAAPQLLLNAYNTENLKWYLGGGGALSYQLVTKNKIHYQRTDQGTTVSESEKAGFYEMQKLGAGMLLRSGIILRQKVDLSVLYFPTGRINVKTMRNMEVSTIRASSLQLSGGYFF